MAAENSLRKLSELLVTDLRYELEKRGINKTGIKSVLVERLQNTLAKEGFNADLYIFNKKNQSKRLSTCSNKSYLHVDKLKLNEGDNINVTTDDLFAKDKVLATMLGLDKGERADVSLEKQSTETTIMESKEIKKLEIKVENRVPKSKPGPASAKIKSVAAAAKESPTPVSTIVSSVEISNGENEDSINLTIGEDEKNLLQHEDGCLQNGLKDEKTQKKSSGLVAVTSTESTSVKQEISENSTEEYNIGEGTKQLEDKTGSSATPDYSSSVIPTKSAQKDEKDVPKKQSNQVGISRNLWVSGLASTARATDLKQVFSKHGKVVGAKVVTKAKTPGARCYGYVTMATNEDATRCIQHLHRTELHGRMISVEKAKSDNLNTPKRVDDRKSHTDICSIKKEQPEGEGKMVEIAGKSNIDVKIDIIEKENIGETKIDNDTLEETKNLEEKSDNQGSRNIKSNRNCSNKSKDRETSPHRNRKSEPRSGSARDTNKDKEKKMVLSFKQITNERERYRLRERERALREDERRRREEMFRNREVERRQREEAQHLKKEREKLQMEREKVERERANILKLELHRQKLERERLEFEKMELKRQQLKIAEAQRNAIKRPADCRDAYGEDRSKRLAISDIRYEPPHSRFDTPVDNSNTYNTDVPIKKDFKGDGFKRKSFKQGNGDDFQKSGTDFKRGFEISTRTSAIESHQSNSSIKFPSPSFHGRGGRDNRVSTQHTLDIPPARRDTATVSSIQHSRGKESRYSDRSKERASERSSDRSTMTFRGSRDERNNRRIETDHRSSKDDSRGPSRDHRYNDPSSSIKADNERYGDRLTGAWHSSGISHGKSGNSMNSAAVAIDTEKTEKRDSWSKTSEKRDSWSKTSESWRQIETNSNDRWSGGPLYPPGAPSSMSLSGRPSSSSYMDHRFNMSSTARKY